MIERIDELLWLWGDWACSYRVIAGSQHLVMRYERRGVMSTNPDGDNPVAEKMDRLIAGFPPYLLQARKAVKRKYMFHWRNEDIAKELHVGRQKLNTLLDRAHVWLDAKIDSDDKKMLDMCAHGF